MLPWLSSAFSSPARRFRSGVVAVVGGAAVLAACNPFAPALDDVPTDPNQLLGNPVTVRGFFERFRASYQLRDSTLYGQLLDRRFTFTFRDFANNVDRSWNRDVEVNTTYRLFRAARTANLQWTQYLPTSDTAFSDTLAYVERSFSLTIEQRDNQTFTGAGSARLVLVRKNRMDPWRMRSWYDRSEF
ncbi:hypothetical protein [Hymenobacter elongatus]|uniref:Uncharacterized protein n=1 Tax=Hymenobacter elongatus TaxID=877208 RepID=A0A4Z0PS51_9BACT|nr:hypothetical protein [Hymenobacter elongatus]TGE20134.1 hypothetical protein E5J99_00770 [Hymenobacter elongatus]